MTREYVISQSESADVPDMFTSALDLPQILTEDWEQRAQHVTLALPERKHDSNNVAKYSHPISGGTRTQILVCSGSENV
jgi:ABC-type microcin C transport system duplicated ATPase subunit YejF